jgi:hypothetical protein
MPRRQKCELINEVSLTLDKYKDEVPVHAMKAYGGVEVWLNTFITSVSDRAFSLMTW